MKIYDIYKDKVIDSIFAIGMSTYREGLEKLVPLIDRYEEQRNPLALKFYDKLKRDITDGCIMPPLTIAIIDNNSILDENSPTNYVEDFIESNIENAFILDGIQRLNTLKSIEIEKIELNRPLFVNILISNSKDNLLYRMITLNNGQRPMSARHQIEILAGSIYNFENLTIDFKTEKESKSNRKNNIYKKEIIIKGYMAFLTRSINMDNTKIIETKMDELIFGKVMEKPPTEIDFQFENVISLITKYINIPELMKWFKVENNFIGFCSAMLNGYKKIEFESIEDISTFIGVFEEAFKGFNLSKINLGITRRKCVNHVFERFDKFKNLDASTMLDELSQVV